MTAALPYIQTALVAKSVKDTRDNRKDTEKENKRREGEEKTALEKAQRDKFTAKKQSYQNTRKTMRRGVSRGRMSTILDESNTLG